MRAGFGVVMVKVGDTTDSAHRGLLHDEQAALMLLGRVAPRPGAQAAGAEVTAGVLVLATWEMALRWRRTCLVTTRSRPLKPRSLRSRSRRPHAATIGHGEEYDSLRSTFGELTGGRVGSP